MRRLNNRHHNWSYAQSGKQSGRNSNATAPLDSRRPAKKSRCTLMIIMQPRHGGWSRYGTGTTNTQYRQHRPTLPTLNVTTGPCTQSKTHQASPFAALSPTEYLMEHRMRQKLPSQYKHYDEAGHQEPVGCQLRISNDGIPNAMTTQNHGD